MVYMSEFWPSTIFCHPPLITLDRTNVLAAHYHWETECNQHSPSCQYFRFIVQGATLFSSLLLVVISKILQKFYLSNLNSISIDPSKASDT